MAALSVLLCARPLRRGVTWATRRREAERAARRRVVAHARWCRQAGVAQREAADMMSLSPQTVGAWERRWKADRLAAPARGRPHERLPLELRRAILGVIVAMGLVVSVRVLQGIFPKVPRRALEDLLTRSRRAVRQRNTMHVLTWRRPGVVWAMDFTEPPAPVDGCYRQVLLVRDLSSGQQLEAMPVRRADAAAVAGVLLELIAVHGAPLVIKSDNAGAFTALAALYARHGILHLRSPPETPRYNGACEAGIGGLKTRAHHTAARAGRPGEWTCDDVEHARLEANATARPAGRAGPVPDDAWTNREKITESERAELRAEYERRRKEVEAELGDEVDGAAVDRMAITRALIERGYLHIKQGRVSLPFKRRKRLIFT